MAESFGFHLIVGLGWIFAAAVCWWDYKFIPLLIIQLFLALIFLLRALYLHLLKFKKGRAFLKKIPIKKIQSEATAFYDEEE